LGGRHVFSWSIDRDNYWNIFFFNTKKMSKGIGRVAVIGVLLGGSWWAYENRDTIGKTLKIDSPTTS